MKPENLDARASREGVLNRRRFLAAATGAASAGLLPRTLEGASAKSEAESSLAGGQAHGDGRLAIHGGKPVRATPLEPNFPGPLYYGDEERRALIGVVNRRAPYRWYGIGPKGGKPFECDRFEKEFAAHQQTQYCVAVTSGTMALYAAMVALGVGPGDEVILPAWTWYSSYDAVVYVGATPVFTEIDDSMDMDPNDIEARITPRTKVIMPVHIENEPADMDPILAVAHRHKLKVLEDAAQSVGATYKGQPVGSMGDCGIYSFQECKNITAGEGGAVVMNDPEIFERAARFHDLGLLRGPHAEWLGKSNTQLKQFCGGQFRMSEFTGAVLRAQLRKLDRIAADFRKRGTKVKNGIADLPGMQFRKCNDPAGGLLSTVYFRTAGKSERDRMISALRAENIPAGHMEGSVILPVLDYITEKEGLAADGGWPSFSSTERQDVQYGASCCPRTIDMWNRYVSLPLDPSYSDQDVNDIMAAVRKVYPVLTGT